MINPYLQLRGVNYKHDTNEFDYNLRVTSDGENSITENTKERLQKTFCTASEFDVMRSNDVQVTWYYFNSNGELLLAYAAQKCLL